jgi:hypothetical protein
MLPGQRAESRHIISVGRREEMPMVKLRVNSVDRGSAGRLKEARDGFSREASPNFFVVHRGLNVGQSSCHNSCSQD